MFGCMDLPGADSAATMTRNRSLPIDPTNASKGSVNVTCGTADYVCHGNMKYNIWAGKFANGSRGPMAAAAHFPYAKQNDDHSFANGAQGHAIHMFSPAQLPVKTAIAQEFGVFNKLFSSVPSMSIPNHLFTQSATSCGVAENVLYSQCGGANTTFPQMTIYDSLNLVNESFGFYVNTTVPHGCDSYPKACDHGGWSELGDANYPDVIMDGVARHQDRFFSYSTFFAQAANGTLPSFSWIAPNQSYCDHPCQDVAKGERLTKDIYEALRAGPGWEKTLLAVLYDDAGGIYDHIVPPFAQTDDAPCNVDNRPGPGPRPPPPPPLTPHCGRGDTSASVTSMTHGC